MFMMWFCYLIRNIICTCGTSTCYAIPKYHGPVTSMRKQLRIYYSGYLFILFWLYHFYETSIYLLCFEAIPIPGGSISDFWGHGIIHDQYLSLHDIFYPLDYWKWVGLCWACLIGVPENEYLILCYSSPNVESVEYLQHLLNVYRLL